MRARKFSIDSVCPLEQAMSMIGGKWKPILLFNLFSGPLRFSELSRRIPLATDQMLTQHLRELERDGLVTRKVYAQVPPKVEYTVTESAQRLRPVLDQLVEWAVDHKEKLTSESLVSSTSA